ncbi:MAG: 23S rRNA (adenine(2503)-C(2))-methyltransferase RlmN [Thermosulfidibacteraceae bacterium]|jgi:23S rRNA (adenine2503-C2)-methyltransferase
MRNIKDISVKELHEYISSLGYEKYRTYQILGWIYKRKVSNFSEMTDIPKSLREKLEEDFELFSLTPVDKIKSVDNTTKLLFGTKDGEIIESVLIPSKDKLTLCISTQIGCRMGCKFCSTGMQGFKRNLKPSEIIDQYLLAAKIEGRSPTNIVIMGMGEPLDNWDNVRLAIKKLIDEKHCAISKRRITLSTVGIIPELKKLVSEFPELPIALSLNTGRSETRKKIMPIEKLHPMNKVLDVLKEKKRTRKILTIEYVLMDGINDSDEEIESLVNLIKVKNIKCKVNLIPFNEWENSPFKKPPEDRILRIQEKIISHGISTFIRKSRGSDILAACGQLRWKYLHDRR